MTNTTYVIEAEDMHAEHYNVVHGAQASGGELVRINGHEGSLSTTLTNPAGQYSLSVFVQDETDGVSTIEVVVNGEVVGTITLDAQSNGVGSNNSGFTEFTLDGLNLPEGAEIELRSTRDGNEFVRIDKIELTHTGEMEVCLLEETFSDGYHLTNSDNIISSDFFGENGVAVTNGHEDGELLFRAVDVSAVEHVTVALDVSLAHGWFEASGHYADFFKVEIITENGIILLDEFAGDGQTLVGSETGQVIDPGFDQLTYILPEGIDSAQIRITTDISASSEVLQLDNVMLKGKPATPPAPSIDAVDDHITVFESEAAGDTETLDSGEDSVLANDTADGGISTVTITTVTGETTGNVGDWIDVAGGGRIKINADGTVDFDANGDFDGLDAGQSAEVEVTYTISKTIPGTSGTEIRDAFNGLHHGAFVTQGDGFTVSAVRAQDGANGPNAAMVFNTNLSGTADYDLEVDTGNILIITEDFDQNDPDDNWAGGTFFIDFDEVSSLESIKFVDIESNEATAGEIRLYDADNNLIASPGIVTTGDRGQNVQAINVDNVARAEIELAGSGGIDFIKFTPGTDDVTVEDTATVKITVLGEDEPGCDVEATGDFITVFESEAFGDQEEILDGFDDTTATASILDNDTENDVAYTGEVDAVNGEPGDVSAGTAGAPVGAPQVVTGSNGGLAYIYADGTVDFDANGEFDDLAEGETDTTTFEYTINCEDDAGPTNLLFVIDTSGSTLGLNGFAEGEFGSTDPVADQNGDGTGNTILDAQLLAVRSALESIIANPALDLSSINVGFVTFNNSGTIEGTNTLDNSAALFDLLADIQGNPNGWTNYDDGLNSAIEWFQTEAVADADNKVVFLSDGVPRDPDGTTIQDLSVYGPEVATLQDPLGINADIEAIAVGSNAETFYLDQLDNTGGSQQVLDATELMTAVAEASKVGDTSTATVTVQVVGEADPTAQISGEIFFDENRDGLNNDPAADGDAIPVLFTVRLTDGTGALIASQELTGSNQASLTYDFGQQLVGQDYRIEVVETPGAADYAFTLEGVGDDESIDSDVNATTGISDTFTLTTAGAVIDAGVKLPAPPPKAQIRGDIFFDEDRNGLNDDPAPMGDPVPVVFSITLKDGAGNVIATQTASGNNQADLSYDFGNQLVGEQYQIEVVETFGAVPYEFTTPNVGTDEAVDSDVDANGLSGTFTLAETGADIDAGVVEPVSQAPLKTLSGSVTVEDRQTVTFIIDNSGSTNNSIVSGLAGDLNNDGSVTSIDYFLDLIVRSVVDANGDLLDGVDGDREVNVLLMGRDEVNGIAIDPLVASLTTSAGEISDAFKASESSPEPTPLQQLFDEINGAASETTELDIGLALKEAYDVITKGTDEGNGSDDVVILTTTDGVDLSRVADETGTPGATIEFDTVEDAEAAGYYQRDITFGDITIGFDYVTGFDNSDDTATPPIPDVLETEQKAALDAIGAEVDVIFLDATGIFDENEDGVADVDQGGTPAVINVDLTILDAIDQGDVAETIDGTDPAFGLADLIAEETILPQVVGVKVGGEEILLSDPRLTDTDPSDEGFQFTLTDLTQNPLDDGTFLLVDTDGDLTNGDVGVQIVDVTASLVPQNSDADTFDFNVENLEDLLV